VLVTGAGGPSAVSIMKSLARIEGVTLWAADIDAHAAGLYLVPPDRRLLLPRGDASGFVDAVTDWCRSASIDIIFPTVDQELLPLALARDDLAAMGVTLVLAGARTLRECLDKWQLYLLCRDLVPAPRTALLDATFRAGDWSFPVIVKPRSGSGSRDIALITEPGGFEAYARDGRFLVQEYLPGEEHSLDVLASPTGSVLAVIPRSRLKVDSGVAVAGRTLHDAELERLGRDVAAAIGLSWVGNVQSRRDGRGVARLLEVNPRFPGTMPLTVAAGVDMPAICLAMARGELAPAALPFRDVAMVRYLEERFVDPSELDTIPTRPALELAPSR
jgi:carbamoyl-phosphate synthase large subunit